MAQVWDDSIKPPPPLTERLSGVWSVERMFDLRLRLCPLEQVR